MHAYFQSIRRMDNDTKNRTFRIFACARDVLDAELFFVANPESIKIIGVPMQLNKRQKSEFEI